MAEEREEKAAKQRIVLSTDAVVQKDAVMVEFIDATFAGVTVIALLRYAGFAVLAVDQDLFGFGVAGVSEAWV